MNPKPMAGATFSYSVGIGCRQYSSPRHFSGCFPSVIPSRKNLRMRVFCSAADVSAGYTGPEENPYEVLGVNPLDSFDKVKTVYKRKQKDAQQIGDETTLARLERAYDKIMMSQLYKRKKGLSFGSVQVSKAVKYADKLPLLPWGPKRARSSKRDTYINAGISAAMTLWALVQRGETDWKPLQFLIFGYMFQLFNKLKDYEPPTSSSDAYESEDGNPPVKSGKRLLRTLALVFGCVAISSLTFTGILNAIELFGGAIPLLLYNNQEIFVTTLSSVILFFMGSLYR